MAKKKAPAKKKKPKEDPLAAVKRAYAHQDMAGSPEAGRARLAELQNTLGRKFGRTTGMTLANSPSARVQRLPFGILTLDWKTGGGLVIGRVNRLWGKKSTLKSTLCLRALRSAQNHCRHCKGPMVRHPNCTCRLRINYASTLEALEKLREREGDIPEPGSEQFVELWRLEVKHRTMVQRYGEEMLTGECPVASDNGVCVDCSCPNPRWWLADDADYEWLQAADALALYAGHLPAGVEWKKGKDMEVALPTLKCEPPPSAFYNADGTLSKKKPKAREVMFVPMRRCEPMRCVYVDAEGTIDAEWAEKNGVDLDLVYVVGNRWGEECLEVVEDATLSSDADLIIIDSTSVLEPKKELEKGIHDNPKVAAKAALTGRWVTRHISYMFEDGLLGRYRPTVLCTSQVTIHGLGGGTNAYGAPTDGNRFEHALSLDLQMTAKGYTFDTANEYAIWGKFEFKIRKAKVSGSSVGATGEIKFYVREVAGHSVGDSDDLATVMDYARKMGQGFISPGLGKQVLVLHSRHLPEKALGFERVGDLTHFLETNPTIYADLRARVLRQLNANEMALVVKDAMPTGEPVGAA